MYSVSVIPKTEEAKRLLKEKFNTIDDIFKSIHPRFKGKETIEDHGLRLYDWGETVHIYVHAHNDYYHLRQTEKDVKQAMKEALGSTKNYEIKRRW